MPKAKSYIGIKNEAASKTLELHFTDYIYDGFDWETWEMKNLVQDTINKIKDADPSKIKVVINSLGGDVMVGLALYNYIKNYKAEKEVEIIGFAASIASVMAMCADKGKLKMAKNSFMIIHAAWSYAAGNADEIRDQADTLDKITNELADIYAQRSGKEAKYFTKLWKDGDYWMTGEEAKEIGLVDELFNIEPVKAHLDFTAHNFKHIPAGLIAAAADKPEDPKTFFSNIKAEVMALVDSFKAAIKGGKENKKFENVAARNEVLEMVEEILSPVLNEIDETIKKATAPAPAAVPKPKAEDPAPAATDPKPAAEEPSEEAKELEKLKAENKKLKLAAAGKTTQPEKEETGNAAKKGLAARARIKYVKDDDDEDGGSDED